jgi:hypothetical protein
MKKTRTMSDNRGREEGGRKGGGGGGGGGGRKEGGTRDRTFFNLSER